MQDRVRVRCTQYMYTLLGHRDQTPEDAREQDTIDLQDMERETTDIATMRPTVQLGLRQIASIADGHVELIVSHTSKAQQDSSRCVRLATRVTTKT